MTKKRPTNRSRQAAKNQPPASISSKRAAATVSKIKPVKKTGQKKNKESIAAKTRSSDLRTANRRRRIVARQQKKQLLHIPMGRGNALVISITRAKTGPSKRRSTSKKNSSTGTFWKKRSQGLELLFSCLLMIGGLFGLSFFAKQAAMAPTPPLAATAVEGAKPTEKAVPKKYSLPASVPADLRIPAIQLDTTLTTVGLQTDKTLEVPKQFNTAGWYRLSPTPGETGPAIVVGHYDSAQGSTIFGRLRELLPGQIIEVNRQDATTAQFIIENVKQFPQDNFPTGEVYGNTDSASLRLITCGGTYNRITQRYSHNTVVFASLAASETKRVNTSKVMKSLITKSSQFKNTNSVQKSLALDLKSPTYAL